MDSQALLPGIANPELDAADADCKKSHLTRRAFLFSGAGLVATAAGGATYVHYVEPYWPSVERVTLPLPALHRAFEGLRLLQISDLHCKDEVCQRYLTRQMDCCTALAPDLVVITGDFLTKGNLAWIEPVCAVARRLSAPLGVVAILGNHDYHESSAILPRKSRYRGFVGDRLTEALRSNGVVVLRNELHVAEKGGGMLQIAGLEDMYSGNYYPQGAFSDVDPYRPCIALSHNPDSVFDLRDAPCDAILSGHTHGGQVRVPFFGAPVLPTRHHEFDAGMFDFEGKRLYVNRGLGYLWPVRFNCRPEITLFTLTSG